MEVCRWYACTQGNDTCQCTGGVHVHSGVIHVSAQVVDMSMGGHTWHVCRKCACTQGNDTCQCTGGIHVHRGMIHDSVQVVCMYTGE